MLDIPNKVPKIVSPSEAKGHIQVIFGPMFSGKTTELIRRLKKYEIANHKCLIVKHPHNLQYGETDFKTHDKQSLNAVLTTSLNDMKEEALNHSVIGIDEGQFFPDIVPFSEEIANKGKIVIIAALDGTFQRKGFCSILQLIPLAESVIKLTSVCMVCFDDASYTKRIGTETQVEIYGGTDKYMAVCRKCFANGNLITNKLESTNMKSVSCNTNRGRENKEVKSTHLSEIKQF